MAAKRRLDELLVRRGLAESPQQARTAILAGNVFVNGEPARRPVAVSEDARIELVQPPRYVGRGGEKLEHALRVFGLDVNGLVALDVGASTGGFTDVLLAGGAKRVYAVDVGRGQLAWKLRNDPRVIVCEGVNARTLSGKEIADAVDLIVCDTSFIGLEVVLPAPLALAAPGARLIALIKPQFEVGKGRVGKGGIVSDPSLHEEVCGRIHDWLQARPGWEVLGICESPITGRDGNKEFLIAAGLAG